MTGALNAAAGLVTSPGYTFNGATKTGFYLAGTNQIGIAVNGVQAATVNSDTSVTFAGTIAAAIGTIPIGSVVDFAGSSAPSGWLLCQGQQVSTTTYAALFTVLSTTYGSGAGTFGIPDYRGRVGFGKDSGGSGRITVAGGNFDGTVLGNSGGGQNQTLTLSQLPTGITSTNPSQPITVNSTSGQVWQGVNNTTGTGGTNNVAVIGGLTSTGNNSISVTSNNTSGSAHTILSPAIITNKIIFAGV